MPREPIDIRHYRFLRSQPPQLKNIPFEADVGAKMGRSERIVVWVAIAGLIGFVAWATYFLRD